MIAQLEVNGDNQTWLPYLIQNFIAHVMFRREILRGHASGHCLHRQLKLRRH